MPHTRNASKRLRQNAKRRLSNRAAKSTIKSQIKKVLTIASSGSIEEFTQECRLAIKKLDKAAAKRVIHPNLAARKKSQVARLLHQKTTGAKTASK